MTKVFVAKDRATARLLLGPGIGHLEQFVAPTTVTEAAARAGIPFDRMYYWVRRFLAAGLVRVAREERRAGRPVKHYVTVAREFRALPETMPPDLLGGQLRTEVEVLARAFDAEFAMEACDLTVQVQIPGDGTPVQRNLTPRRYLDDGQDHRRPATWSSGERWLTEADAVALIEDLRRVVADHADRAKAPHTKGTRPYHHMNCVVPAADEA